MTERLKRIQRILGQRPMVVVLLTLVALTQCSQTDLDLVLKEVEAQDIHNRVNSHQGSKAVLLNFWATWCFPCVEEFPMIVELGKQYATSDLTVYFVSVDWLDYRDRVLSFLKNHGVSGLSFIKNQDNNEFINGVSEAWTGAVPFTIIYDKTTGNVVDYWESKEPRERFVGAIEKALHES